MRSSEERRNQGDTGSKEWAALRSEEIATHERLNANARFKIIAASARLIHVQLRKVNTVAVNQEESRPWQVHCGREVSTAAPRQLGADSVGPSKGD